MRACERRYGSDVENPERDFVTPGVAGLGEDEIPRSMLCSVVLHRETYTPA